MEVSVKERRREDRIPVKLHCDLLVDNTTYTCRMIDVSEHGLAVLTANPDFAKAIKQGDLIEVTYEKQNYPRVILGCQTRNIIESEDGVRVGFSIYKGDLQRWAFVVSTLGSIHE